MNNRNTHVWPGWETVRQIGRGGFGAVYEIQRDVYGRQEKAALKVITIPHDEDEIDYLRCTGLTDDNITQSLHKQVADIAREYNLMSEMRENPNVVRCDDFKDVQHEDKLGWDIYIKMELLTPLMKCLDKVQTEEQVIRLGTDMCNALVTCQEKNIIHRDIKPQNIFISDKGQFKLGDFGIARTAERTTRATAGIGTYSYMAPEVEGNEPYGKTVDIYSLGLVLFWLLNERRSPFVSLPPAIPGHNEEQEARTRRLCGEKLPAPKNGSEALKAIVLKACAYDSKDRYQSAQEMLDALNTLNTGLVPPAEQIVVPLTHSTPATEMVQDDDLTVGPSWSNVEKLTTEDLTVGPGAEGVTETEDKDITVGPVFQNTQFSVTKVAEQRKPKGKGRILAICAVLFVILTAALLFLQSKQPFDKGDKLNDVHEHQLENGKCVICGEKCLKIALCFSGNGAWELIYENKVNELCQEYGWSYQLFFADTATVQIEQVAEVIGGQFDAMIIQPIDRNALVSITSQAAEEGIIIIDHHNFVPESGNVYKILLDETEIGRCQAEEYVTTYTDQGNIAIIAGPADSAVMAARLSGIQEVLRNYPGINIVEIQNCDLNAQAVQNVTEKIIAQNQDLHAIFVQDDEMVEGVVLAVEKTGKQNEISVVSQDFAEDSILLLQERKLLFTVGVPGASAIAEESMKRISNVADGLEFDHVSYLNLTIIDQSNIDENLDFLDEDPTDTPWGQMFSNSDMLTQDECQHDFISAGTYHSVALTSSGTVVATNYTGDDYFGYCDVEDWTDIVAVSAGDGHTMGLKADGTVIAVGQNEVAQCTLYEWSNIVAVSAGFAHSVGLRADGTVVAVGRNDFGQCNVQEWTDIVAISAGAFHTVGLKKDGTVVAVGDNSEGQCYVSELSNISAISAGYYFTAALKDDGTVTALGSNHYGQLSVDKWKDIVAISTGWYHTVGLKANGTVVAVGSNFVNQVKVQSWTDIVAISAGRDHTVGLKTDGTVVAVGHNGNGQCDVGTWTNVRTP